MDWVVRSLIGYVDQNPYFDEKVASIYVSS